MIRVKKSKSECKIETYYNKTYEDQPQVFVEPSLTDQSYFIENDIYTLLSQGCRNNGLLQYGVQDFSDLSVLQSVKNDYMSLWNRLSFSEKIKYGDFRNFVSYISNPVNYDNFIKYDNFVPENKVDSDVPVDTVKE